MTHRTIRPPTGDRYAFSLVELMAAMALIILLMAILIQMTNQTRQVYSQTKSRTEAFREAREAFDSMTRRISQATLNTYYDYSPPPPATPTKYVRQSELRFVVDSTVRLLEGSAPTGPTAGQNPGAPSAAASNKRPGHAIFFSTPVGFASTGTFSGFQTMLNTWGYFVDYADNDTEIPEFAGKTSPPLQAKYRYRLMELSEPTEKMSLYQFTSGTFSNGTAKNTQYFGYHWFRSPLRDSYPSVGSSGFPADTAVTAIAAKAPVSVLAENVLCLVVHPRLATSDEIGTPSETNRIAPRYRYDSTEEKAGNPLNPKNQLPPVVQTTIIAMDEASANRLGMGAAPPDLGIPWASLFQTHLANSSANFASNLRTVTDALDNRKITYRVFTTNVNLRSAKWSRD